MTDNSTPHVTLARLLGWIGLLWTTCTILLVLVLPFFWLPVLQWKGYEWLQTPCWLGAALGPFLMLGGLGWGATPFWGRLLRQTLGTLLLLIGIVWLGYDSLQIFQGGWAAMRSGPTFLLAHKGIFWGPGLLTLGYAFITQDRVRNQLGLLLTTMGYQALLLALGYRLFYIIVPNFVPMLKTARAIPPTPTPIAWDFLSSVAFLLLAVLFWASQLKAPNKKPSSLTQKLAVFVFFGAIANVARVVWLTPLFQGKTPINFGLPTLFRQTGMYTASVNQNAITLFVIALVLLSIGVVLLTRPMRGRTHLVFAFPLWLPFFILFFFWSLITNTTFYLIEDIFRIRLEPNLLTKAIAAPFCLILFPLFLTIDFALGLMNLLGHSVLHRLFPPEHNVEGSTHSNLRVYGLGALMLFTMPLWALPFLLFLGIRLFVYESILVYILGQKAFDPKDKTS